jgi:hypothetical protein
MQRNPGQVLKLKKALYGLKQAGRQWSEHLKDALERDGWKRNPYEPCLYQRNKDEFILVYVDDILIIAPDLARVELTKTQLSSIFPVKDLGEVNEYLGVEIQRDRSTKSFLMRQLGSLEALYAHRKQTVPMSPYLDHVRKADPVSTPEHEWFRSIIGMIQHVARFTRPDICTAINFLSRKLSCPTQQDLVDTHKLIGYLSGTKEIFLLLKGDDIRTIAGYSDADWAGDKADRKSTSGFICYLGNSPDRKSTSGYICYLTKKQKCTAASSFELEYIALSDADRDTTALNTRGESITRMEIPAILYCDNQAAETVANGDQGKLTKGSKHISLRYHIVREKVSDGELKVTRVDTKNNRADIFTKPLGRIQFIGHRGNLPVIDSPIST